MAEGIKMDDVMPMNVNFEQDFIYPDGNEIKIKHE